MIAYWFYICVCIKQNSGLQQTGRDTQRRGDPPSWSPPSPFSSLCPPASSPHACFRSWGQRLDPATNQHLLRLHYPSKPSTAASSQRGSPASFSRLLSHPRPFPLAPAWPLVDLSTCPSAGSSLPHECRRGRACWGLDANRRQRICNSLQQHILPFAVLGLELSPAWLRVQRGTDVHSHAHAMPVHTFMSMCVQVERWYCIWWWLE